MTPEEINVLQQIVAKANANTGTSMLPALISAGAMVLVALSQFFILKWVLSNDLKKISFQLQTAKEIKQREEWINNFKNAIAEFLMLTDPDLKEYFDRKKMTLQIYQIQLLLSRNNSQENEINELVNKLALNAVGMYPLDEIEALRTHGLLIDRAQALIKQTA